MQRHVARSDIARYAVAVVSVSVAVLLGLWLRPLAMAAAQLLLVCVLITAWVGGLRPALVAWALATLGFEYYFTAAFTGPEVNVAQLPRLIIFTLLAGFLATMSAARRRAQDALKSARDDLEARVRERTARFRDLVNSVDGIVWEAEAATFQFLFVSDQAERIVGYRPERWLSEPTFWKDHLHPDDRDRVVAFRERATDEKRDHDCEYRMIGADRRVVWLRDLVTVVVEERATRLRGVMVDITERKHAEAALREQAGLLDLTHDTIFVRDMSDVITYWNRAAEEFYGWTAKDAVGKVSHQLMRTIFPAPFDRIQAELLRTGRWEGELVHTKADGSQAVVASRWSLQHDERGQPVAILETNNDITHRKKAEETRRWIAESLSRVDHAIQGTNDLEQMMSDVLDAALAIFDCDRAWLMHPCDPEAVSHQVKMQRTRPEFPSLLDVGDDVPIDAETAEMFRVVRVSSGPVQFGPHSEHPLSSELAQRLALKCRIVMALYPKGEAPYTFGVSQCSYARLWTPREEFLFQEIGRRLEDALTSLSIFHRLRESEKRYRHIFESTGVSIWEEDFSQVKAAIDDLKSSGVQDFRAWFAAHPQFVHDAIAMVKMVDVNATAMKSFAALTKDELLASLHKVFVAETDAVFVEELVAIAEGRAFFEAETVLQTLKGERLTVLFTATFPPSSARFDSVLVTVMDITGRKRAELLTGYVFETSPDAIYIVGRDYRYQRVNAAFERRWRMPAERIVGMRVDELVGREPFEETFRPSLDRCFAGEEVSFGGWFLTPGGRRYLAATYSPVRLGSEGPEAVLAITRDLSDLIRASESLQQAQAELAHVTRVTTLGELAASIAHEVNQPLAAIVADANASLNWLASHNPDLDGVREALDAIVKDGHRAADVIHRIRQLATKTSPQKTRLDVNDVIREVVPLVGTEIRRQQVSVRVDLAPALPPVLGDRVQLQQVLINLVMNGIEAMTSAGERPRELLIRSHEEGGHVLMAVRDAGVGLDPNKIDQLFSAFFTTKPGGMGMGLSISRSIIEGHGGRLWATPNPEHGATFHVALPSERMEREHLPIQGAPTPDSFDFGNV